MWPMDLPPSDPGIAAAVTSDREHLVQKMPGLGVAVYDVEIDRLSVEHSAWAAQARSNEGATWRR